MTEKQHVFIVGAKSLGAYGGYETFVNKLTEYHQDHPGIQYHIACKANGIGAMHESLLENAVPSGDNEFTYHNAHCFKIRVPDIGAAQAICYDVSALDYCCKYIKKNGIKNPVVYVLACRIGPFAPYFRKRIHRLGGKLYVNPDGHEWLRAKWSAPVRKYWKLSERMMMKYCDLAVCDSLNIEKYIHESYDGKGIGGASPKTTFIAYGADLTPSTLDDQDPSLLDWYSRHGITGNDYFLIVGRLVPENSFSVMLREFMASDSGRDLVIIATKNEKYMKQLEKELHFSRDKRIKFVGTLYEQELLKKVRENAFASLHGHTVGGTNPSLIEALGSTQLNLLVDVGFNTEVAEDSALYWSREPGSLAGLISRTEKMTAEEIAAFRNRARERVTSEYTWDRICSLYDECFTNGANQRVSE